MGVQNARHSEHSKTPYKQALLRDRGRRGVGMEIDDIEIEKK